MSSGITMSLTMLIQLVWPMISLIALLALLRFHKLAPAFPLILIGLGVQCLSSSCSAAFFLAQTAGIDMADHMTAVPMFFTAVSVIGMAGRVCFLTGLVLVVHNLHSRIRFLTEIVESRQD